MIRLFPNAAGLRKGLLAVAVMATTGGVAHAASAGFQVVHSFSYTDGDWPYSSVTAGSDGRLYGGTSQYGSGANGGGGTLYAYDPVSSVFSVIYGFAYGASTGYASNGALVQGLDGYLYGVTFQGGANAAGTIFKVATDGSNFQVLHDLNYYTEGQISYGPMLVGPDGFLYGSLADAGNGNGSIFRIAPNGSHFQVLHTFNSSVPNDGYMPWGPMALAPDGFLYGSTVFGGANFSGAIYRLKPDGSQYQVMHSFAPCSDGTGCQYYSTNADGEQIESGLTLGSDGALYGTARAGGLNTTGTVFRMTTRGTFKVIHQMDALTNYTNHDGCGSAASLVELADGNFLGMTSGCGAHSAGEIFEISPDGKRFAPVHDFTSSESVTQNGGLVQADDGAYYGTSSLSGSWGYGTLFKVTAPPASPHQLRAVAGANSVTLTWRGSGTISGFNVYVGTSPGAEGATAVARTAGILHTTIRGLKTGVTYYFTVTALDAAGNESLMSTEASATAQ